MAGVTRLRQGLTNFIAWMRISKGMDRLAKEVNAIIFKFLSLAKIAIEILEDIQTLCSGSIGA